MSGAAILLAQNGYVRRFRDAGATSPDNAKTLEEIGCRDSWLFGRMIANGVFVQAGKGTYYMDEAIAEEFLRNRRNRVFVLAGVLLAAFLIWWLFAY